MAFRSEKVRFMSSQGVELAARLDRPAHEPRDWVLFAHCFSCSKDLKAVGRISRALTEQGFGVFRFDFTGLGESEGDFADTNFSSNLADLIAAVDHLRSQDRAPRILVGHSLGGAAVLAAAGQVREAAAVATIGAPSDTRHLSEVILDAAPELKERGEVEVHLAGRPFTVKRQLVDDLEGHRLEQAIASLRRPLLVLHSPIDEVVGIDHARRIFEAAKHPKSFISLDDADHLLQRREEDAVYTANVLAAWASRYLERPATESTAALEHGKVRVTGGGGGLVQQVIAGHHELVADEPTSVPGGTDTGPAPYDFLLTALGACTNMTLRMYAERKGWPLEGVETYLEHDRIHATDCEDCDKTEGRVDRIRRSIEIDGPLDADQRKRLMEIADMCPVHRTLTNEIKIRTEPAG